MWGAQEVPQKARYPNRGAEVESVSGADVALGAALGRGGPSLCPSKGVKQSADPWHDSVGTEPAATLARDGAIWHP